MVRWQFRNRVAITSALQGRFCLSTPINLISDRLPLPKACRDGSVSLEKAIATRRSVRDFRGDHVTAEALGQILWACQGLAADGPRRTVPSAGASYPLEIYVVAGNVTNIPAGVHRYDAATHSLWPVVQGDVRRDLYGATVGQTSAALAPVTVILAAVYDRITNRYGTRGMTYALMEAGHAGQNLYLQATALELGTVAIGAFREDMVRQILNMGADEHPLYLFPVGHGASHQ